MNKHLTIGILIYLAGILAAQENIKSFIKLDTLFNTGIQIDNRDVSTNDVKIKILEDCAWIYYPNWKENDSIHFLKINLKTHKKEVVNINLPGISFKVASPVIIDFDINKNALVVYFSSNSFSYFKNTKNGYVFDFIEPLQGSFSAIRLLPEDQLLIYNNYNSHPKDNPDRTILHVYDCKNHKIIYTNKPRFNAIQFSHFSPNQWLDVSSKNIVFAQTTSYSMAFFNFKLNVTNNFMSKEKNWVYADTIRIKALESVKPALNAKGFIENLMPMEDSVCRIEAVYFLNDTKLLVRKIPANAKQKNRIRTYDILVLDANSNSWKISHHDIVDIIDPTVILTKDNFPVNSVYHNVTFSENYFVKLLPRFTPIQFNKTYQENKDNEEKAMGTVTPELYIQIFKANYH